MPDRQNNWAERPLGEFITLQRGYDITRKNQTDGPYPVISSSGFTSTHNRFTASGPGVVIGRKGTLGKAFYVRGPYWAHDTTLWVRDFKGNDPKFVYYLLKSMDLATYDVGASNPTLNRNHLHLLSVAVPNHATQQRIAVILSAYDDLIEVNQRRIAVLEEMARRLFDEWFVRFRYPGHEAVPLVETERGLHPTGWQVKPLGDLVETQYGYTTSASAKDQGPKFLRGMDINKSSYIEWATVPYCQEPPENTSRFALRLYDILIIRMADPGKVAIVESEVDAIFASYLVRLAANYEVLTPYFLFYTLCGQDYQNYVLGAANGATRKSIPASLMVSFQLAIPPRRILKAFESVVAPIRKQAIALVQANSKLRAARDLLLPKLISGEIDVTGTERDLAEAAE